jgi:hypothetical protein
MCFAMAAAAYNALCAWLPYKMCRKISTEAATTILKVPELVVVAYPGLSFRSIAS